jgi:hypothetical protein
MSFVAPLIASASRRSIGTWSSSLSEAVRPHDKSGQSRIAVKGRQRPFHSFAFARRAPVRGHPGKKRHDLLESRWSLGRVEIGSHLLVVALGLPPAGHRHQHAQQLVEVEARRNDLLRYAMFVGFFSFPGWEFSAIAIDQVIQVHGDLVGSVFPVRRDQDFLGLLRLVGKRDPHVGEDR